MFGGYLWQPLVLLPGVNSTHLKNGSDNTRTEDGLLHRLAGLPGPALSRFTAGAAVPDKTPGKTYS